MSAHVVIKKQMKIWASFHHGVDESMHMLSVSVLIGVENRIVITGGKTHEVFVCARAPLMIAFCVRDIDEVVELRV